MIGLHDALDNLLKPGETCHHPYLLVLAILLPVAMWGVSKIRTQEETEAGVPPA
jgi:hypothetical protein